MNNTITLRQAIEELYSCNAQLEVKGILAILNQAPEYTHLQDKAAYRPVYNTLKRVMGTTKPSKPSKVQKTSIVFDLTQTPVNAKAIPGKVVCAGRR
jgi:hypothetical protein